MFYREGRAKELDAPCFAEGVQLLPVRFAFAHDLAESDEKTLSVHCRQDHHELARRFVGDIEERMSCATRHAEHVARSRLETLTIHLEQVASFEDPKDLRLGVPVERWTESGRIGCLNYGESISRCLRRQPYGELETNRRNLHHGKVVGGWVEELKGHESLPL